MDVMRELISCLINKPHLSNAEIGRLVGRDSRVVARYRRLVSQFTWDELAMFDGRTLRMIFNPKVSRRIHAYPPFAQLVASHPRHSVRGMWKVYTNGGMNPNALSYSQFLRLFKSWRDNGGTIPSIPVASNPGGAHTPSALPFQIMEEVKTLDAA